MPELILLLIILFPVMGMTILALIQCQRSAFQAPSHKVIWMLMVLMAPIFGPIMWWVLGVNHRKVN